MIEKWFGGSINTRIIIVWSPRGRGRHFSVCPFIGRHVQRKSSPLFSYETRCDIRLCEVNHFTAFSFVVMKKNRNNFLKLFLHFWVIIFCKIQSTACFIYILSLDDLSRCGNQYLLLMLLLLDNYCNMLSHTSSTPGEAFKWHCTIQDLSELYWP